MQRIGTTGLTVGLNLIAVVLLGLHMYVRWLPPTLTSIPEATDAEAAWWGLWPVRDVPTGLAWGAAIFVVLFIGGLWHSRLDVDTGLANPATAPPNRPASWRQTTLLTACAALLIGAFFAFPIAHTRWGDAYLLNKAIAWPDPALRLTHSWQAPLDLFLHSQLWLSLHEKFGWTEATPVYRLLSPLAGAIYLLIALLLSRKQWLGPAWLTFGSLATLGLLQLFFGYIENYSFAAAGILLYLWLALGVCRAHYPLWLAALALAVTNATHPSTIVLAPSLLYLGWRLYAQNQQRPAGSPAERRDAWRTIVLQISVPMMAIALATIFMMELGGHGIQALLTDDRPGGGDARWLVPLFETSTRWEYYTMFSWGHLCDFLNEQMLVAPVVLPALAWIGLYSGLRKWRSAQNSAELRPRNNSAQYNMETHFLLIAAFCYGGFTWLWNPDYGGQRDWDLFSLAAIPAALLLVALLSKTLHQRRDLRIGTLPLLAVQALHTAAWIYQNTLPWSWP